jgi:hypothetical protein
MVPTEAEFQSLKQLYDSVKDGNSASYAAFWAKLERMKSGNPRTYNALLRQLGIDLPKRKHGDSHPSGPSGKRKIKKPTSSTFLAYDGEGWKDKLVLLANSNGDRISNSDGLSTKDCLELLSQVYDKVYKRIFFSFGYDVNHIIRDLSDEQIETLVSGLTVDYEGYRLNYIPGKIFTVNNIQYFDVFSFFQTNFINVVKKMLGEEYVTESLIEGKSARGTFETWNLDKIIAYNDEELSLLIQIMDKLRNAFETIGVYISDWYGPGAVAKFWFKEHGIAPREKHTFFTLSALNDAYYGGRFEQISLGKFNDVYEYDIHSAYPSVMAEMPYFTSWKASKDFIDDPYSVWYLTFDLRYSQQDDNHTTHVSFLPLPVRSSDGRICFPLVGKGWYWYPEVKVLLDYFPKAKITFHRGYVATAEGRPFEWIKALYDYRLQLKDSDDLSEYGIKVGLNSLYGKCAQRVGHNPYFSLAWAGYITSATRAKLARAGYENGSQNVIGFATDALFAVKAFDVSLSDSLGDWEESRFASGTFFQSGVYRLQDSNGHVSDRYRGSPLRHGIDNIIQQLTERPHSYPVIAIGRFISHMLGIKAKVAYGPLRLQFIKVEHTLALDAPYKRHYIGFLDKVTAEGKFTSDFSRLLRQPIHSIPKVYVNDNDMLLSEELLYGKLPSNIESNPPPMKDSQTQRLMDEGGIAAIEGGYDDVSSLEALEIKVVEDELM